MAQILSLASGKWNPPKATYPSMHNRSVIVTGSNTGIGLEAALKFVQLGAKIVVLAVRTLSKGEQAKQKILARAARFNARVEVWECDMLDYDSLRRLKQRAERELPDGKLDYLVLNAGILSVKLEWSKYGWENMLQCHVLSTTYLALLMLPLLEKAQDEKEGFVPVLEIVNSTAHSLVPRPAALIKGTREVESPLELYNRQKSGTLPISQYSYSKLFLMVSRHDVGYEKAREIYPFDRHLFWSLTLIQGGESN
jgi:NAD(P)-dependent dehydrogenase (short-subunit alcohol dehydrogenase family)